ncbi:conserved hypothetical protein [Rippkaea orientalis PCC 8801]|uniref:Uncharacterized protein n=1 Tax=Rippkaea orientalis (strain PCC 8801 / RF-1) TaxID=41431 RepID=B7JYH0_RIPO1|nr:hypothetical protein [Rippkaea orientalis]ACK64840.1 conserved hypothetical protein [Rippkaea orientalis PCC 8801]
MLVILANDNILSVRAVCQGCLLANNQGLPRWNEGKLSCGYSLSPLDNHQPQRYQCEMGFQVAQIEEAA